MTDTDTNPSAAEHSVIAHFRLAETGFGDSRQRATVRGYEKLLAQAVEQARVGQIDGNEYGGGRVALYAYGPDADALYAVMEPLLRQIPFRPAHVFLRHGSASDPTAAEHRIDL